MQRSATSQTGKKKTKGHKMKDFLGHELNKGDRIITIVNIRGGSAGCGFVIATIEYITRTRLYLKDWDTKDEYMRKEYTTPDKAIRIIPAK